MKKIDATIDAIRAKIQQNAINKSELNNKNEQDNNLLLEALNVISNLQRENNNLNNVLNQSTNNYLSTTQFFNPSLAKDFYNMNGNSLATNSYLAVRTMLGIAGNKTPNVMVPIFNQDGTVQPNANGTAVGLTTNKETQGWWLWTMILNAINYFQNMFKIECEDKKLKKAIHDYLLAVVLSGYAFIEKKDDKYITGCITNCKLNQYGELTEAQAYNPAFIIQCNRDLKENEGLTEWKPNDNSVYGMWRSNGYSVWYYVMCYMMNSVDLLYIFWNRARLNKTIIEQKKGNNSTAVIEAENYINPYQNVVTINTVGILNDDGNEAQIENRYEIKDIGNGAETQYSWTNFLNWTNWWNNEVGIRAEPSGNGDGTRSITDEVQPLKLNLNKQQNDFLFQLELLCDNIKEKWGIEVKITLEDLEASKENPETKDEQGNQSEQRKEDIKDVQQDK